MPPVRWDKLFIFTVSPFELFLRGTLTYLLIFVLMRLLRREPGGMGLADLLVLVMIADAAQNAIASDYTSILDGAVLIGTLVFWNYAFDWLSLRSATFGRFSHPAPVPLIRDGKFLHENMRKELITRAQLLSVMREHGIEHVSKVRVSYLEGNGKVSVITKDECENDDGDDSPAG